MKTGEFLIATPNIIGDNNFQRAVVLLVDDKKSGAIGFILNKKLNYTLDELMEGFSVKVPLYFGGPVEQDSLFFIHTQADLIPNSTFISNNFYWSRDYKKIIELINKEKIKEDQIQFFLGYSGWSDNQLENEIESKSWVLADPTSDVNWILNSCTSLWREHMTALGGKYLLWSNTPENPNWN